MAMGRKVFAVLIGSAFSLYLLLSAVGVEAQAPAIPKRVRLVLADFEKLTGHARFDLLEQSIPQTLNIALLPYDTVELVKHDVLWSKLEQMAVPPRERTRPRMFQTDLLRAVDVDYLLRGSFIELRGTLRLSGVLYEVKTNRELKIGPIQVEEREILSAIGLFASELASALSKAGAVPHTRLFAVSCFEDKSRQASPVSKSVKRDLAAFLTHQLTARKGTRVKKWDELEKFCDQPPSGFTLASQLNVDAVIGGSIRVEKNVLYIYPVLFVAENLMRLEMSVIEGGLEQYLQLKISLGRKVAEFLDGSLDARGLWKVSELLATTGPEAYLRRGKELFDKGNITLAVLFFERALTSKSLPEAHYYLGLIRMQQKRFEEASEHLQKAINVKTDFAAAYKALGQAYASLGRYQDSIGAYETALRLDPALQGVYVEIGNIYFIQGNNERAKQYYRRAATHEPKNPDPYYLLGVITSRETGKDAEAITLHKRALEIDPGYGPAQRGLGALFHGKGIAALQKKEYKEAISYFTEEIQYNPTAAAYFARGSAQVYLGVYGLAIADYQKVLQLTDKVQTMTYIRSPTLLGLTELYILAQQYSNARDLAESSLRELRSQAGARAIARFLLAVSRILVGQEYDEEITLLRVDLAGEKHEYSGWDFSLLDQFIRDTTSISKEKQELILTISDEVQRALRAGGTRP